MLAFADEHVATLVDWAVAAECDGILLFPPLCDNVDECVPKNLGCSQTRSDILSDHTGLKTGHLANQDTWDLLMHESLNLFPIRTCLTYQDSVCD